MKSWRLLLLLLAAVFLAAACAQPEYTPAQREALERAKRNTIHIPKFNRELENYNRRQRLADDATAIVWCTGAFPVPASPLFTVAVVGKLTSGNKRPYATQIEYSGQAGFYYEPELPGPDGMYGSSGEYRYGFTPADVYVDFYNISTFCTTEPMVWQRESTIIVTETDNELLEAQKQAQEALKQNRPNDARRILDQAVRKTRGR